MNANENIREDKPRDINPDEVNKPNPAKELKSEEKVAIDESGLGRDQGQTPADEHIETRFSQIDDATKDLQNDKQAAKGDGPQSENETGENRDAAGYMNDVNSSMDRDTGDSTESGWNAESSKTGRHK